MQDSKTKTKCWKFWPQLAQILNSIRPRPWIKKSDQNTNLPWGMPVLHQRHQIHDCSFDWNSLRFPTSRRHSERSSRIFEVWQTKYFDFNSVFLFFFQNLSSQSKKCQICSFLCRCTDRELVQVEKRIVLCCVQVTQAEKRRCPRPVEW